MDEFEAAVAGPEQESGTAAGVGHPIEENGAGADRAADSVTEVLGAEGDSVPAGSSTEADGLEDGAIGHPRVRRICRAAQLDVREARLSRWADTVDLLTQRAPHYLEPFLAYAEG